MTVLISGASSGLGQACARRLAAQGAKLVLIGRRMEELKKIGLPEGEEDQHVVIECDVTAEASQKALAAELKAKAISLNAVVLAAGIQDIRPLMMETLLTLQNTWMVNVFGSLGLLAVLLKGRLVAKEGSIVLFSSAATHAGGPGLVSYAASKGALEAATHSLALELASQKIRVNAIAPGVIPTPMSGRYMSRMTEAQTETLKSHHPLGFGEPDDAAGLVSFLVSPDSKWMTGAVLNLDGGLTSH